MGEMHRGMETEESERCTEWFGTDGPAGDTQTPWGCTIQLGMDGPLKDTLICPHWGQMDRAARDTRSL